MMSDCSQATTALPPALGRALARYEFYLPCFPGKWRTVKWLSSIPDRYASGIHTVERRELSWQLDTRCFIQRSLYYLGTYAYESRETEFVENVLRPGWCVVDVGANFGYYSLLAAQKVGPSGTVCAFEPSSPVFEQLATNLRLNSLPWVHPIQCALGDAEGSSFMPIPERWNQQLQGVGARGDARSEHIRVTTLDRFVQEHACPKIDLIKADIEGYEPFLLRGATGVIREFSPILILELNPVCLQRFGFTTEDFIAQIKSYGYTIFSLYRRGLRQLERLPRLGHHMNIIGVPTKCRDRWVA